MIDNCSTETGVCQVQFSGRAGRFKQAFQPRFSRVRETRGSRLFSAG